MKNKINHNKADGTELAYPERITIRWLLDNATIGFWLSVIGLIASAFGLGVTSTKYEPTKSLAGHTAEIKKKQDEIDELDSDLSNVKGELTSKEEKLEQKSTELSSAVDQNRKNITQIEKLDSKLNDSEREINALRKQLGSFKAKKEPITYEFDSAPITIKKMNEPGSLKLSLVVKGSDGRVSNPSLNFECFQGQREVCYVNKKEYTYSVMGNKIAVNHQGETIKTFEFGGFKIDPDDQPIEGFEERRRFMIISGYHFIRNHYISE